VVLHNPMVSLVFLAAAMFFNEMNIGPMWAIPMDVAYDRSGTASGIMSGSGFTAAIVSPVVAGFVADRLHNWDLTFALSIGVMICGVILSFFMKPNLPFSNGAAQPRGEPQRTREDAHSDADAMLQLRQR
jgi:MFS family permease